MYESIRRVLSRPRAKVWILAVSALLAASSVPAGLAADDFVHEIEVSGNSPIQGFRHAPLDLFRFADPKTVPSLMEDGVLPWWSDPQVRFAFFRPLAAASHLLDHALFPGNAVLMHLHTLAWHLLGVVAAGALYRSVFADAPGWTAMLALAFYALDDARGAPVAWVANRNELIGCALSLWAITWHRRASGGRTRFHLLGSAAFALGLLASEGAIAVTGYLFAHVVFLESGPLPKRLLRLWPYATVTFVWAAIYHALGYGIARSGVYFDPLSNPAGYLGALPERFAMLWLSQLGGPWSEGWNAYSVMFPGAEVVVAVFAALVLIGAGFLFMPLLRTSATARFWLTGAVLATLPACGAFPADRLLPWVGVGAMGITAEFFVSVAELSPTNLFARAGAAAIVFAHLVMGPLLFPLRAAGIAQVRAAIERADRGVPSDPSIATKIVVYLNPPADPFASYIPITRAALGVPRPKGQRWLATGAGADVSVERVDEHTLLVKPKGGLLTLPSERLFRDTAHFPFHRGDVITLAETRIAIAEVTPDGRPATVLAHFEKPLEDSSYVFLAWKGATYAPFELPPVGSTVTIPPVDLVTVAYGPDNPVTRALGRH